MRIAKKDENILIIKDQNFFGFLFGSIFLSIGLIVLINPSLIGIQPNGPTSAGLMAVFLGSIAILLPTLDSATFDKAKNKLVTRQRNLFWNRQSECNLNQIQEICLWIDNSRYSGAIYKLVCILDDGREIGLNPTKSGMSIGSIGPAGSFVIVPAIQTGEKIANFLDVPFVQRRGRSRGT